MLIVIILIWFNAIFFYAIILYMRINYTFLLPNGDISKSIFKSNSPKNSCIKIFNRILRESNEKSLEVKLIILDLQREKKFYYLCHAVLDPHEKQISKDKIITIKYDTNITKLSKKIF